MILILPSKAKRSIRAHTLNVIKRTAFLEKEFDWKCFSCPEDLKRTMPDDMFSELMGITFEGHDFLIISSYDHLLSNYYGKYMQLPPESDRICKDNPEIVDFGDHE